MTASYKAVFTPDEDGVRWNARIVGKPGGYGCATWGRSLSEARKRLLDALATALEDEQQDRDLDIVSDYEIPARDELAKLRAKRAKVDALVRELAAESAAMARSLCKQGYSMRDVAELIGTSHARVQQWVSEAPQPTDRVSIAPPRIASSPRMAAGPIRPLSGSDQVERVRRSAARKGPAKRRAAKKGPAKRKAG